MKDRATKRQGLQRRGPHVGAATLVLVLAGMSVAGLTLGGCSLSVPIGPTTDETPTGTIRSGSPFSAEMDAEDWRRARSALDTALDPQGNGASVAWDNPSSGAKGAFVPLAQVYPKGDAICRAFAAHLTLKGRTETVLRASACRVNSGNWVVGHVAAAAEGRPDSPRKSDNLAERDTDTHLR